MVAMKQEKIGTRNGASTVHDVMSLAMDLTDVRSSVRVGADMFLRDMSGMTSESKGLHWGNSPLSEAGLEKDMTCYRSTLLDMPPRPMCLPVFSAPTSPRSK